MAVDFEEAPAKPEGKPTSLHHQTSAGGLVEAKVLRVLDGDTFSIQTLNGSERVRLYGIDCPEDGQPWGDKATDALNELIGRRDVYLEIKGNDPHGRTLATVYVMIKGELRNVNEEMVKCGHAWVTRVFYKELTEGRRRALNVLERWAKTKPVGLWKTENPIPPWEWRKKNSA